MPSTPRPEAVRTHLAADAAVADPRKYLGPAREAVAAEAARLLKVLNLEQDSSEVFLTQYQERRWRLGSRSRGKCQLMRPQ